MNDMLVAFERLIDTNTVSCVDRLELPACTERSCRCRTPTATARQGGG